MSKAKEEKEQEKKEKEEQRKADTAFNGLLKRAREKEALIASPEKEEEWDTSVNTI